MGKPTKHWLAEEVTSAASFCWNHHNSNCFYCGISLVFSTLEPSAFTRDHVLPVCRKGRFRKKNIVPACLLCNRDKGPMSIEEFRRLRYKEGKLGRDGKFWGELRYATRSGLRKMPVIEKGGRGETQSNLGDF